MSGGLWGALKKFQSITESAFISFGERLAPAVVWGANVFAALPGPIQEVVVVTGSMVAAMGGLMLVMPKSFGSLVQLPRKLAMLVTSINLVRVKTIAMAVAQKAATAAQWLMNAAMTANPIGLIIAAIGLLVVAWLKWDDEIKAFLKVTWGKVVKAFNAFKEIARDVYKGIRLWLGDRLGAIFKGIRDKVEWVVGLFTDMKDKIVGNSIVPDMVDDLDAEFQRMGEVMTYESAEATDAVVTNLEDLTEESIKAADATRQLADEQQAGTESASGYDLALAGLSGQMGGATGQALNLVIAMREHNKEQRAAAEAGRETEQEFSEIQQRAATLGFAFTAIGEAIGGTAGTVLTELGTIAQAFATGGVVGGIMAGIASLAKGLKGLFSRGKKKREAAAKAAKEAADVAAKAAEEAAVAAAKIAAAMEDIRLGLLGMPTQAVTEDFRLLRDVWNGMNAAERAQGMDRYVAALQSASAAGIVLSGCGAGLCSMRSWPTTQPCRRRLPARKPRWRRSALDRKPRWLESTRRSTPLNLVCGQRSAFYRGYWISRKQNWTHCLPGRTRRWRRSPRAERNLSML